MRATFLKNPLFRFVLTAAGSYFLWYVLYESWLKPYSNLDEWVISHIVAHAKSGLSFLGYHLTETPNMAWNHIAIEGTGGVLIGAPCDGIILFTLFSIFVVAFPGSLKHKLWFIPLGILSIHIVNVMRVIALAVIVSIDESWLSFNHDYTFTILTYAWVFTLWVIWVKRFSPLRASNRTISKD